MGEQHPLWVVCDASGSMQEAGKAVIVRNLLAFIIQANELLPGVVSRGKWQCLQWGSSAELVDVQAEIPSFHCSGQSDADSLLAQMEQDPSRAFWRRVLLLTDGHWTRNDFGKLKHWFSEHRELSVRIVAVGCDANIRQLQQLAGSDGTFPAEEIVAAFSSWCPADDQTPRTNVIHTFAGTGGAL